MTSYPQARLSASIIVYLYCVLPGCGRMDYDPDATAEDASSNSIDANRFADAAVPPNNIAFVTSTRQAPGLFGGLEGADSVCSDLATAANLPGTYIAWLSTDTIHARDRLGVARGWVRTDESPLVDRIDDLISGGLLRPLRFDENGEEVSGSVFVATGTAGVGTKANNNCDNYTNNNTTGGYGISQDTGNRWTYSSGRPCGELQRMYCFGVDRSNAIQATTPAAGRQAFMSVSKFTPSSGIAAADALCTADASLAGLSGSYLALLATGSTAAIERFELTSPWVRLDGIALAETALDFAAGHLDTALHVNALGQYIGRETVWTGGAEPLAVAGDTSNCGDWTQNTDSGLVGRPTSASPMFFNDGISTCDTAYPIYCLEE